MSVWLRIIFAVIMLVAAPFVWALAGAGVDDCHAGDCSGLLGTLVEVGIPIAFGFLLASGLLLSSLVVDAITSVSARKREAQATHWQANLDLIYGSGRVRKTAFSRTKGLLDEIRAGGAGFTQIRGGLLLATWLPCVLVVIFLQAIMALKLFGFDHDQQVWFGPLVERTASNVSWAILAGGLPVAGLVLSFPLIRAGARTLRQTWATADQAYNEVLHKANARKSSKKNSGLP